LPTGIVEIVLIAGAGVAVAVWAVLAAHLVRVQRSRTAARSAVRNLVTLAGAGMRDLPLDARLDRMSLALQGLSRELVMSAAADRTVSVHVFEVLASYLTRRWGADRLEHDATAHRTSRDKWRRIAALRILARQRDPRTLDLLEVAIGDADPEVASTASALLGSMTDPRALQILVAALRRGQHPPARITIQLDQMPVDGSETFRELLTDSDPVARFWAAVLLARYPNAPGLDSDLALATLDPEPRVRKAAVESLGKVGGPIATEIAAQLLYDPAPFVRANAALALGEIGCEARAEDITALLGDADWWVRKAAKEALVMMGADVWPVLMRCLEHPDRFVRNGAAEVFQDIGVLDSLVVMEAATPDPAPGKIQLLRQIAVAGEVRFTDSLVERAGPVVGPRIRDLLATLGFERAGTA
jgi:HEAT repeat protein